MDRRIDERPIKGEGVSRYSRIKDKIIAIADLIRLSKQYGTLLVLLPTLWSLMLASYGRPPLRILIIFVVGTFLMRSVGCAINDIADRDFDRHVDRTKDRPIASGRLSVKEALAVFIILSLIAFSLVLMLNRLTILLSFVGIGLAIIYPFVKRVSHLPQLVLGMAFGWGAIMAWAAVRNTVEFPAVLIFIANIFWSTAYDTIYALMDIEDDVKVGVKSTAILFGRHVYSATFLAFACVIAFLVLLGIYTSLGWAYFLSLAIAFILFSYEIYMIKASPERETAFAAFVFNVVVGSIILLGISIEMV